MDAPSEEVPKKARRGRPAKKNMLAESSNANDAPESSSSANVSEFELALKALPMKVRASTVAAYRMPLEHWKVNLNSRLLLFFVIINYNLN
jgi:hypothetical protein